MTVLVIPRSDFSSESKLAKILECLKWKIIFDRTQSSDLVILHSDEMPYPRSMGVAGNPYIVNMKGKAIDKARVNEVFENVFGYPLAVRPESHQGPCVEKVLGHQQHGIVLQCPHASRSDRVYQKIITNHPEEKWLEEWRIDVYDSDLLVTRKQLKKQSSGFPGPERNPGAFHFDFPVSEALFAWEISMVNRFLDVIGMQYGSLDALRDLDGRLYIIDATTNTACPNPMWHGNVTEHQYIKRSAEYFKRAFSK